MSELIKFFIYSGSQINHESGASAHVYPPFETEAESADFAVEKYFSKHWARIDDPHFEMTVVQKHKVDLAPLKEMARSLKRESEIAKKRVEMRVLQSQIDALEQGKASK